MNRIIPQTIKRENHNLDKQDHRPQPERARFVYVLTFVPHTIYVEYILLQGNNDSYEVFFLTTKTFTVVLCCYSIADVVLGILQWFYHVIIVTSNLYIDTFLCLDLKLFQSLSFISGFVVVVSSNYFTVFLLCGSKIVVSVL